MPDFNQLLLFVAVISPLIILARTARRAAHNRGWQLAAGGVLLIVALAWIIAPRYAGYVGGGAWFLLLFLPVLGLRKAAEFVPEERYTAARRIVGALRWLHPAKALRDELRFLRAMELAQNGRVDSALALLTGLRGVNNRAGLQAAAQSFRLRGDWPGLLEWGRRNLPLVGLGREPALLPLYYRALGETGNVDELVLQVAGRAPAMLASPQQQGTFDSSAVIVLAFTGNMPALTQLLQTRFRGLRADTKEFWRATCALAGGAAEAGRERLLSLQRSTKDALVRADSAQRLREWRPDQRNVLNPAGTATMRRFEKNLTAHRRSLLAPRSSQLTPAVAIFIGLNVAMFLVELSLGGSTNYFTLHRLGALEPVAVLARGEYWRLLGALFLHYGALHLLVNLYALYVLGPPLEASIGGVRFAVCYLVAGLGSSAGVLALWRLGWTRADLLVGASGAVMGIVGAWAGFLLQHHHLPMVRRRLLNIAAIVVMQTAFDYLTPQVSMAAHLCGVASGLVIALLIIPRRAR